MTARLQLRCLNGCHKAIAPACNVDDKSRVTLSIAQGLTQTGDAEPQAPLVNSHIWPHLRQQFPLVDDFTGAQQQNEQEVERPIAYRQKGTVSLNSTLLAHNAVVAEREADVALHSNLLR